MLACINIAVADSIRNKETLEAVARKACLYLASGVGNSAAFSFSSSDRNSRMMTEVSDLSSSDEARGQADWIAASCSC
jgi:hypothetical protein